MHNGALRALESAVPRVAVAALVGLLLSSCAMRGSDAHIGLPARAADAAGATELYEQLSTLPLEEREARLTAEVLAGNVPSWLREWQPVTVEGTLRGELRRVQLDVLPDYLAIGSDDDFALIPLTATAAQRIADELEAVLPTPAIVDAIWDQSEVRLGPDSIPPGPAMTTMPVFWDHDRMVADRRDPSGVDFGKLTAGHKKDVVLTPDVGDDFDRVVIYGWHRPSGEPIQPIYGGHAADWVDYSHGIRLVSVMGRMDGREVDLRELLADPEIAPLLSPTGPILEPRYPNRR